MLNNKCAANYLGTEKCSYFSSLKTITDVLISLNFLLPPTNEVWGNVIFSQACVIPSASVHSGVWETPPGQTPPPPGRHPL